MMKVMSKRWYVLLPAVALFASVVGCNKPIVDSGPSYAELVVTYNAELEALDRLEANRKELIEEYAAASAPNASANTLSKLEGLLKSARGINDDTNLDVTSDPNALLDSLAERSDEATEIADQVLDRLLGGESNEAKPEPTPEEAGAAAERKAAFETERANLDLEITKQKERVERARQARDAAEAKSKASE